jgi:hypothetical protein
MTEAQHRSAWLVCGSCGPRPGPSAIACPALWPSGMVTLGAARRTWRGAGDNTPAARNELHRWLEGLDGGSDQHSSTMALDLERIDRSRSSGTHPKNTGGGASSERRNGSAATDSGDDGDPMSSARGLGDVSGTGERRPMWEKGE